MPEKRSCHEDTGPALSPWNFQLPTPLQLGEYLIDAGQRSILFWDVMRQRSNQYREHMAQTAPNVLHYDFELVLDGRKFERPVNYGLVRILPPAGVAVDGHRRPFVVIDPRAGHGPGIGGFKADSEIGVALQAGHPCYLVGFLPELTECVACGRALNGDRAYFHALADGLMCAEDKRLASSEISKESRAWAAQMFRAPVDSFMEVSWPKSQCADLRKFLIQILQRHIEKKLVTAGMLEKGGF